MIKPLCDKILKYKIKVDVNGCRVQSLYLYMTEFFLYIFYRPGAHIIAWSCLCLAKLEYLIQSDCLAYTIRKLFWAAC